MRRMLLCGLVLVLSPALAAAQQVESGWAGKLFAREAGAPLTHDFGTVPAGALLSYKFPMYNPYAVPLTVTQVRVSCGCVTVTAPPGPIGPKESATLDVTMDARKFKGPKVVSIFVTVGPQYVSTAALQVTAFSRADVVVNYLDQQQTTLGIVPQGRPATIGYRVEYAGSLDWRIVGVARSAAPLEVRLQEHSRVPGRGAEYRVYVTLKETAPAGPFKSEVLLETNDPSGRYVPLLVEGVVQAPLAVVPAEHNFGTVPIGQTVSKNVILRGNGRPFRILGIDGQTEGLTVEVVPVSSPNPVAIIKYRPLQPGVMKKQLRFRTDLDSESVAGVTVEAVAVP
jgi:hypothetical protein